MRKKYFEDISLLYVEDEENIRKNAISYFSRLFSFVYEAKNGVEALKITKEKKPNIIITDIKMPSMTGLEFIKKLREFDNQTQVIVLTAFTDTSYLLQAVELGLVKYLVKPIRHDKILPILIKCVENIKENESNLKYISKTCIFDTFNKSLVKDSQVIKLTKNEIDFLQLLTNNLNKVVTYEQIENKIWYDSYMSEDAIRSLVRNLRRKLPSDTLKNIAKIGYKIDSNL